MPKIRGIFDHAKPRNASSYNSRAAPSPHTLMRASAPPHLAQPACLVRSRARPTPRTPRPVSSAHLALAPRPASTSASLPKCTKAGPEG